MGRPTIDYIAKPLRTLAVPMSDLNPDAANARTHDQRNIDAIARSLSRWGQRQPIVVQKQGMVVRAGNGRLAAAKSLGWSHIAAIIVDEDSTEATAYAIADNRTAELAGWDDETLASLLQSLDAEDRIDAGFDDDELQALIDELTPAVEVEEDEAPEPPANPVTKPGDLWTLGRHRVLCGDCTDGGAWSRLELGDAGGVLCFTSPPYNLGASAALMGNTAIAKQKNAYDTFDDKQTPEEWRQLVDSALSEAMEWCDAAVFNVQPLAGNRRVILRWIADRDDYRDIVTWDKGHATPPMADGVLAARFEWLVVFGRGKSSRRIPLASWRGTLQSLYVGPPQRNNECASIHGATFPVHLPSFVVGDLCNRARAVVDCFCGTGTTIIAAEQLGRVGYGIELSPAYVDVIVRRWENLTGEKATRVDADGNPQPGLPDEVGDD